MNLLFSFADLPWWTWVIVAAVVLVAVFLIVIIVVCTRKKTKKANQKKAEEQKETKAELARQEPAEQPKKEQPAEQKSEQKEQVEEAPAKPAKPEQTNGGKVYHISKRKSDGKWQIKLEGGAKAIKLFATQAEAIAYGKTLADNQDARFVLHKTDGSFRKLTY